MNRDLTVYLRIQAAIAAVFNFFISGIITALIHHKADFISTDTISIMIDLTITCLLTFAITTPFCRASLRRDKTGGVLAVRTHLTRLLSALSRHPALLCISFGLCAALILSTLMASFVTLLGVTEIPFYLYLALKSVLSAILGVFATCAVLYAGMLQAV